MASLSITTRKLKNGRLRLKAEIVVKKNSQIIHRESKTFSKKELARVWGKETSARLEENDVFFNDHDLWNNTGRTKKYVCKMLMDCDIAKLEPATE